LNKELQRLFFLLRIKPGSSAGMARTAMNLLCRMKTVPVPGCLTPSSPLRRLGEAAPRHGWLTFPLLFGFIHSVAGR
jgi:hypothetical protein